jgi:hypothetical protein
MMRYSTVVSIGGSLPGTPPIGYANPLGLAENPAALAEPIIKPEADFILIK